jgi:hypothetical protein
MKSNKIASILVLFVISGFSTMACGSSSNSPTGNTVTQSVNFSQQQISGQWNSWLSTTGYRSFQNFCQYVDVLNQDIAGGNWGGIGYDGAQVEGGAKEALNEAQPPADTADYQAALQYAVNGGGTAYSDGITASSMSDFNNVMPEFNAMNSAISRFTQALGAQGISSQQTGCLTP